MSFDRFLLAAESRDLSQADKSIIRVSSFSILQNLVTLISKKKPFGTWPFGKIDFYHSKFAESSGLSC